MFHPFIKQILVNNIYLFRDKAMKLMSKNFTSIASNNTNQKYSSLYVSSKYGQEIFRLIEPSYDVSYINFIAENIHEIENLFNKRSIHHNYCYDDIKHSLKDFAKYMQQTESLKKKRNRLLAKLRKKGKEDQILYDKYKQVQNDFVKSRDIFYVLEQNLIPFLLDIPNDIEPTITEEQKIMDQCQQKVDDFQQKCHNYIRLGYINNLYQRSIVGPNANYLQEQGARLYYGLIDMICDQLHQLNYVPFNGLDLVKSAFVEAVNSRHFATDPYMLQCSSGQNEDNQRLHLVGEASLESFCVFILNHQINRGQFYQIGSSFESNQFEQKHNIRATVITGPNESSQAMKDLYRIYWNLLNRIGLYCCSIRTDIKSLFLNEYDKYVLLAFLKSRNEWIQIGQLSHYHHYISQRLGINEYKDCHLISSSIDLTPLIYSIVEQFQIYETGKIDLPTEILKYLM